MRIAYVITRADDLGGAQVHVRDLAEALRAHGHAVHVLAGGAGKFSAELGARGIPFYSVRNLVTPIAPFKDALALLEIVRTLREIRPDLVAAHTAKAGLLGRIASAMLGIPAVFTPHGWSIADRISPRKGKIFRRIEAMASTVSSRIINVCDFEVELALQGRVAGARKLAMVHNGLADVGLAGQAEVANNPPRLVMIARMAEPKDHSTLLAALASLRHLPWEMDLIGDGPLEEKLRLHAGRLGLTGRVHFRGFSGNPAAELAGAQIFVLSSRSEAFPYSILEAMRAGLPVVATRVGGVPEAVVEGETGFLVPPGNPSALAGRLARLITDAALRARLGQNGRQRYLQRFTFEQMFAKTFQIYRDVLDECASSRARIAPASLETEAIRRER